MNALFLGPGQFTGDQQWTALDHRRRLARLHGKAFLMEDEADQPGEADPEKFIRLATNCDEILVWLPARGRLPTVFAELVALRFRPDQHTKRLTVFYERDVLDATGSSFNVNAAAGRIAYLRDLRDVFDVRTWRYETEQDLDRLVSDHGRGWLEDA